jgi:aspartate aminotransferase
MTNKFSTLAENLNALSISSISEKINTRIKAGEKIFNLTIGDFAPTQFPIPKLLEAAIIDAYRANHTNYATVGGMAELRTAIANHIKFFGDFDYSADEIIVGSGSRPLIYILLKTLVNPGEKIINVVPSWNNYNFIYLTEATAITLEAKPENNFLPTADDLKPLLADAALITFNAPLNPAGTVFNKATLSSILELIIAENKRRLQQNTKPIYLFFDIVYAKLIYGNVENINPIKLNPAIRDYLIFIDGISKCFAATGVRVGWAFGPKAIVAKMRLIIAHIGAWAPKPEQIALARFLEDHEAIINYLTHFKDELYKRLTIFYNGFLQLKQQGYKVDVIAPTGAIYLAIKIDLLGTKTNDSNIINSVDDITLYILECAKVALVPFYAFGASKDLPWFRLSVGTCSIEDAKQAMAALQATISNSKF